MKYLTNYKIFEYRDYKEMNEIISNLKDMSLEFEDNECSVKLNTKSDIHLKLLSLQVRDMVKSIPTVPFYLEIDVNIKIISGDDSRRGYESLPDWFINSCKIIEDYMSSEGFKTDYSVRYATDWENFNSIEELASLEALIYNVRLQFILLPQQ